jgi:hypothetical protein
MATKRPARRATRKNSTKKTGSRRARPAPATGPVTLRQATALAKRRLPAPPAPKAAVASATPASVAAERRRLELKRRQEKQRRIREYAATMAVLESRGVKGLRAEPAVAFGIAPGPAVELALQPRPLRVLAEGDSWFEYPVPAFGGSVIDRLQKLIGVPILNLADAGDETRFMLGVKQRQEISRQLKTAAQAGRPWDVMLFSGGGNDIVDHPMALWILDFDPTKTAAELIHDRRFAAALALVRGAYEDLIGLRDRLSSHTHLIFHGYDYAIPDGRGVCGKGPWMRPTFEVRRFPYGDKTVFPQLPFDVVKVMLTQFAAMLDDIAAHWPGVSVLKTQGVLTAETSSWHNELHPNKTGFNTFAGLFRDKLRELFPERLP